MQCRLAQCAAVAAVMIGFGLSAVADEKIPLDKLPPAVVAAVRERFPDATLLSAEKETENGRLVYEVKIRTGGMKKEVDVTPDGKIVKVENEDD